MIDTIIRTVFVAENLWHAVAFSLVPMGVVGYITMRMASFERVKGGNSKTEDIGFSGSVFVGGAVVFGAPLVLASIMAVDHYVYHIAEMRESDLEKYDFHYDYRERDTRAADCVDALFHELKGREGKKLTVGEYSELVIERCPVEY